MARQGRAPQQSEHVMQGNSHCPAIFKATLGCAAELQHPCRWVECRETHSGMGSGGLRWYLRDDWKLSTMNEWARELWSIIYFSLIPTLLPLRDIADLGTYLEKPRPQWIPFRQHGGLLLCVCPLVGAGDQSCAELLCERQLKYFPSSLPSSFPHSFLQDLTHYVAQLALNSASASLDVEATAVSHFVNPLQRHNQMFQSPGSLGSEAVSMENTIGKRIIKTVEESLFFF